MLRCWKSSCCNKQLQQRNFSAPPKTGYHPFTANIVSNLNRGHRRFSTSFPQITVSDLKQLKSVQIKRPDSQESIKAYLTKNAEAKYAENSRQAWSDLQLLMFEKRKRFFEYTTLSLIYFSGIGPLNSALLEHPSFGEDYKFEKDFMEKILQAALENPFLKEHGEEAFNSLFATEEEFLKNKNSPFWLYRSRMQEALQQELVEFEEETEPMTKDEEEQLNNVIGAPIDDEPMEPFLTMTDAELKQEDVDVLRKSLNTVLVQYYSSLDAEDMREAINDLQLESDTDIATVSDETLRNKLVTYANDLTSKCSTEELFIQLEDIRAEFASEVALSLMEEHIENSEAQELRELATEFGIKFTNTTPLKELRNNLITEISQRIDSISPAEIPNFMTDVDALFRAIAAPPEEPSWECSESESVTTSPSVPTTSLKKLGSFGKELLKMHNNKTQQSDASKTETSNNVTTTTTTTTTTATSTTTNGKPSNEPQNKGTFVPQEIDPDMEAQIEDDFVFALQSKENATKFLLKYAYIVGLEPEIEKKLKENPELVFPSTPEDFPKVKNVIIPDTLGQDLKSLKAENETEITEAALSLNEDPKDSLHHLFTTIIPGIEKKVDASRDEELISRIESLTNEIESCEVSSYQLLLIALHAKDNRKKIAPAAYQLLRYLKKDLELSRPFSVDTIASWKDYARVASRMSDPDEIHDKLSAFLDRIQVQDETEDILADFEEFALHLEQIDEETFTEEIMKPEQDITETLSYQLGTPSQKAFLKHNSQMSKTLKEAYFYQLKKLNKETEADEAAKALLEGQQQQTDKKNTEQKQPQEKEYFTSLQNRKALDLLQRAHPLIQELFSPTFVQWNPIRDLVTHEIQSEIAQAKSAGTFQTLSNNSFQNYVNQMKGLPEKFPNQVTLLSDPPKSFAEYLLERTKTLYQTPEYKATEATKIAALRAEKEALERNIMTILFSTEKVSSSESMILNPNETEIKIENLNSVLQFTKKDISNVFAEGTCGNFAFDSELLYKGEKMGLLIRSHVLQLVQKLENAKSHSFMPKETSPYILLDGPKGSGKSQMLNLIVHWARRQGWLVVFLHSGYAYANPTTIDLSSIPNVVESPIENVAFCKAMLKTHQKDLSNLPVRLPTSLFSAKDQLHFSGKTLADLLQWGANYPLLSGQTLAHFRKELGLITEMPVLVVIDEINSWWNKSKWYDIDQPLAVTTRAPSLYPNKLVVPNAFSNFENHGLANGIFLVSTSPSLSMKNFEKAHPSVSRFHIPNFSMEEWQSLLKYHHLCQIGGTASKEMNESVRNYWFRLCEGNAKELLSLYRKAAL